MYAGFGIFLLYFTIEKRYIGVILGALEVVFVIFIFEKWFKKAPADESLVEKLRIYCVLASFAITWILCGLPLLVITGAVNLWDFGYTFVLAAIASVSNSLYISIRFGKPLKYRTPKSELEELKLYHEELRFLANSIIWATLMFIIGAVVAGATFWWEYAKPPAEILPILATYGAIQVAFFVIGIFLWIILPLFVEMGKIRAKVADINLD